MSSVIKELSAYQAKIIDWAKNGTGHGCCNAVAGSGKSTTLRLVAKELENQGVLPSQIKICVFGKANASDLVAKFGKAWESSISTIHSAGWNMLKTHLEIRNPWGMIKGNKYKFIAQDMKIISKGQNKGILKRENALDKEASFLTLVDLVRLTNSFEDLNPELLWELCSHFEVADIWDYEMVTTALKQVIEKGERLALAKESFDFCDQIWLPVRWNLGKEQWFQAYKYVLVDEAQDLNATQLELVVSLAGAEGRILAVADPFQAIMGFSGSDNKSYEKIVVRLKATQLPLSTCYRCPKSHIELVNSLFPDIPIEAAETASMGEIHQIREADLWNPSHAGSLREQDMVISRKTSPLVNLCIKLISKGIAATVKGRAIGEQIKGDLQEIGKMPGFKYEEFNMALNAYRKAKYQRYEGLDNEEQLLEALSDKLEAISTIYESQPGATRISDLETYIDSLFSDDKSPITLSTCHRAKGLEGNRIFILNPGDMPMAWRNQQEWQAEQEDNLLYVALTRSKSQLFIVGATRWYVNEQFNAEAETTVEAEVEELIEDEEIQQNETQSNADNERKERIRNLAVSLYKQLKEDCALWNDEINTLIGHLTELNR